MSLSDDDITNIFGIVKKVLNHQPSKVGSKYGTVHGAAIEKNNYSICSRCSVLVERANMQPKITLDHDIKLLLYLYVKYVGPLESSMLKKPHIQASNIFLGATNTCAFQPDILG